MHAVISLWQLRRETKLNQQKKTLQRNLNSKFHSKQVNQPGQSVWSFEKAEILYIQRSGTQFWNGLWMSLMSTFHKQRGVSERYKVMTIYNRISNATIKEIYFLINKFGTTVLRTSTQIQTLDAYSQGQGIQISHLLQARTNFSRVIYILEGISAWAWEV